MKKLTEKQQKDIHFQTASGCKFSEVFVDLVWTHSQIVKEIALQLATKLEKKIDSRLDKNLIIIGSLLHDIGVYRCFDEDFNPNDKADPYFYHGWIGEKILRKLDFPEKVIRFTITHTSTGITTEDIKRERLNLELKDYIPVSIEEEIVNFADKFHTKSPSFVTYDQAVEKLSKFDPSRKTKMETLRKKYGLPDLDLIIKNYHPWQNKIEKFFSDLN